MVRFVSPRSGPEFGETASTSGAGTGGSVTVYVRYISGHLSSAGVVFGGDPKYEKRTVS
jgi:hypothetical protein